MRFHASFLVLARPTEQKIEFLMSQMKLTEEQIELCIDADPSPNQTDFVTWIARWLAKGQIRLPEDGPRIKDHLSTFLRLKRTPGFGGNKDINAYNPGSLAETVAQNTATAFMRDKNVDKLKALPADAVQVVYNANNLLIYKTKNPQALMILSDGTDWCTRHEVNASSYLRSGPSYVVFYKGQPYAQLHAASNQYMDKHDRPFWQTYSRTNGRGWGNSRYKTIAKGMSDPTAIEALNIISGLDANVKAWAKDKVVVDKEDLIQKLSPYAEFAIDVSNMTGKPATPEIEAEMPDHYWGSKLEQYADKFHPKGRWEPLEKAVLKNATSSDEAINYAKNRVGGRWPELETILLKGLPYNTATATQAIKYAEQIIGGRWLELEQKMMKGKPNEAKSRGLNQYAQQILKARWNTIPNQQLELGLTDMVKAEYVMAIGSAAEAIEYAKHFIHGPWPELEQVLRRKGVTQEILDYLGAMGIERDNENETNTLEKANSTQLYEYAKNVIKGRDPKIEQRLLEPNQNDNSPQTNQKRRWDNYTKQRELRTAPLAYAENVIKGRWPELEKKLLEYTAGYPAKDSTYGHSQIPWDVCEYLTRVMKGRWPELEALLLQRYEIYPEKWEANQQWITEYLSLLGQQKKKQDWPEGRQRLAERSAGYENILLDGLKEGEAEDKATDREDGYNLYSACDKLFKYLKGLYDHGASWPEGNEILEEYNNLRAERVVPDGGRNYWNKQRFESPMLQRASFSI